MDILVQKSLADYKGEAKMMKKQEHYSQGQFEFHFAFLSWELCLADRPDALFGGVLIYDCFFHIILHN